MATAFYVLGGVVIAAGALLTLVEGFLVIQAGRYVGLIAIVISGSYIMLAGALFVAVGAIIRRLDWIMLAGRLRPPTPAYARDDEAPPAPRRSPAEPPPRRSKIDRYFR